MLHGKRTTRAGSQMQAPNIIPPLRSIKAPRHSGVSSSLCHSLCEAAEVCLARHHTPPMTSFHLVHAGRESDGLLNWAAPDDTAQLSWNNRDDATRDGAYIVSLAVVEHLLGMVALSRADTRSGADYYVGMPNQHDLEDAIRLEISGIDSGSLTDIRRRLKVKEEQVANGNGSLPAYASVVGFREATVLISEVREKQDE